jgi:hypothetical protein
MVIFKYIFLVIFIYILTDFYLKSASCLDLSELLYLKHYCFYTHFSVADKYDAKIHSVSELNAMFFVPQFVAVLIVSTLAVVTTVSWLKPFGLRGKQDEARSNNTKIAICYLDCT